MGVGKVARPSSECPQDLPSKRAIIAAMKPREESLSHETLTRVLDYDPATGVFVWKVDRGRSTKAGSVAGTLNRGYVQLSIEKKLYAGHRVAWFYVHKTWPANELDHINMVRDDNRMVNLREVTKTENNRNVGIKSHNSIGFKGVCKHKDKFVAYITVNSETKYLGIFHTPEEASAAYAAASKLYHGEYGRSA